MLLGWNSGDDIEQIQRDCPLLVESTAAKERVYVQDNLLSHALLDIPGLAWFRSDSMRDDPDYNEEVMVREYEVDSVGSGDVMTERSRDGDSLLRRPLLQEGARCWHAWLSCMVVYHSRCAALDIGDPVRCMLGEAVQFVLLSWFW